MIHKSTMVIALLPGLFFLSEPSGAQHFSESNAPVVLPVHVKRLNSSGQVIGTFDVLVTSRNLSSGNLNQVIAGPVAAGSVSEQTVLPNALVRSTIYDNSTTFSRFYEPGQNVEVIDFGTSSGGKVFKFEFGYATNKRDPGDITIRFYWGTNGGTCPGTFLAGWVFSGLPGANGQPKSYIETIEVPVNEQFILPAGDFGTSYEFAPRNVQNISFGVFLASGGAGNQDMFWKDCVSTIFSGTDWAGFYMKVFAEFEVNPVLRIDPNSLTFDCDGGAAAGSLQPTAATNRFPAKMIDEETIRSRFNQGADKVHVIVNLIEPETLRLTTNWPSRQSRKVLQTEVASRQQQVLGQLTRSEFRLKNRYENISAFSGEISEKALDRLVKHPLVRVVEPVRPLYPHLNQGLALMNAFSVRSTYSGQGIAIAICDTGTDYNHPQLGGGGFPNSKVIGGSDIGDTDSDPIPNTQNHGTAVSGLAGGDLATFGDYVGGVAHSAKLYALKISTGSTGSSNNAIMTDAWDWCVSHQHDDPNHPIMVINTSFGGGQFFSFCDSNFPALSTAAANAAAAGITVVCSAGNDGYCDALGFPACFSNTISVGAVYDAAFGTFGWCVSGLSCANIFSTGGCSTGWAATDTSVADKVTVYSNTASFLDILAPSNQAYTTDIVGNGDDPTGNFNTGFGGTSAASPYVAGVVACLQSAALDLTGSFLTPAEVRTLLVATGDPVTDPKTSVTKPRVNLGKAVDTFVTAVCTGKTLTIFNDGNATLDITSITTPNWLTLSDAPPFSIGANSSLELCVTADCNSCAGIDPNDLIEVFSNDPNATPSYDISVFMNCPEITLTLNGAVRTVAGFGIGGVALVADNGGGTDTTDPNGMYAIPIPLGWSNGTVTPSKARWSFDPNGVAYAGPLLSDPNAQDYVGKVSADFNLTLTVDYGDFSVLNSFWMNDGCGDPNWCGQADMDLSGIVDANDLILFDEQWLGIIN